MVAYYGLRKKAAHGFSLQALNDLLRMLVPGLIVGPLLTCTVSHLSTSAMSKHTAYLWTFGCPDLCL